jgi:bifunctional DNA-binding transcriptional regulator/antitoxin component of YhaV-PrlF toxin-antitoxin module
MKTRMSSKGQLVLPASIGGQDGIEVGQEFDVVRIDRGEAMRPSTVRRRIASSSRRKHTAGESQWLERRVQNVEGADEVPFTS